MAKGSGKRSADSLRERWETRQKTREEAEDARFASKVARMFSSGREKQEDISDANQELAEAENRAIIAGRRAGKTIMVDENPGGGYTYTMSVMPQPPPVSPRTPAEWQRVGEMMLEVLVQTIESSLGIQLGERTSSAIYARFAAWVSDTPDARKRYEDLDSQLALEFGLTIVREIAERGFRSTLRLEMAIQKPAPAATPQGRRRFNLDE